MDAKDFMPSGEVIAGIKRDIARYEVERAMVLSEVRWRVPAYLGALFILSALVAYVFNGFASPYEQWLSTPHVFLYLGTLVAAIFLYRAAMRPAKKLGQNFRDRLLPIIFGFIDDLRHANGETPASFDRLPRVAVGSFNRQSFDDVVSGSYDGFRFELYEAKLSSDTGKSQRTVFKGVVTAFETITPFAGLLVAAKRAGTASKFFGEIFGTSGLETVSCGIPSLDEAYEVRTDNPGAAGPAVAAKLAKALQWLSETWPGEPARVVLQGNDGFLLLPLARNLFELPGIGTPLDYKAHVSPIVAEMVALLATAALMRKAGTPDAQPGSNQS